MMRVTFTIAAAAAVMLSVGAARAEPKTAALFTRLLDCKTIAEPSQRLACYDTQVGALEAAEKRRDVVVVDREQIKATRKSLFGFTLPKIGLLSGSREDVDDVEQIETTLQSVRWSNHVWQFVLPNEGGTWETGDALSKAPPKAGDKITISRASMGSYLAHVGWNRGVRLRRVK